MDKKPYMDNRAVIRTEVHFNYNQFKTTKVNVDNIIELIKDATQCHEWSDHVAGTFQENQHATIPQYVIPFYNMGRPYWDHHKEPPWIQKFYMKSKQTAAEAHLKRYTEMIKQKKKVIVDPNVFYEQAETFLSDKPNYTSTTNFSAMMNKAQITFGFGTLVLFQHIGIRRVGDGSDMEDMFSLWHACGPTVNHRLPNVQTNLYGKTEEETQYIPKVFKSKNLKWAGLVCAALPYKISTGELDDEGKPIDGNISVGPYLQEPSENQEVKNDSDDRAYVHNGFAANKKYVGSATDLTAADPTFADVSKCFKALTVSQHSL